MRHANRPGPATNWGDGLAEAKGGRLDLETVAAYVSRAEGLVRHLGIEMRVLEADLMCRMPVQASLGGSPGVAHGGAVMTLLDSALGLHAMREALKEGKGTSTVEMKVNFLRPAKVGTTLITQTQLEFRGRSLVVVSGFAFEEATEKRVALALGTFNLFDLEVMRQAASSGT